MLRSLEPPALATVLGIVLILATACAQERRPGNVHATGPILIISIDTLRADHLPAYGSTTVDTPNLDALATDSIVFENAYAQAPLTLPSHASAFTGRLPADIAVRNNLGYRFDPAIPSIPALLRERGYATGAAISAYVLRSETGLGALFDYYDDALDRADGGTTGEIQRPATETVAAAIDWIRARNNPRFFFFLHLFEPHAPYNPPEPFLSRYASSPYEGEIAAADDALAPLISALKDLGLYEDATIILMSDHGEGLGDHGESQHGIFLYREAIHVPLFLKLPRNHLAGTRVATPVGLTDLFPTITKLAGIDRRFDGIEGHSLVDIANGLTPDRRIFSETMYPRIHLGWSDLASLIDQTHHYIEAPLPELYDLRTDPRETRNVLREQRRVFAAMQSEMRTFDRTLDVPANIAPEDAAKLAALGYLGGGGASDAVEDLPDPKDRIADLELYVSASDLVRDQRGARAIGVLEQITARNAAFADAWTMLAKAYEQAGRPEDAVAAYRRTIETAPMLAPGTALSLAEILLRLGRLSEALEHADLALQTHPSSARLARARIFFAGGDHVAAEAELTSVIADRRTRADGLLVTAQIRAAQRRPDEALATVERVAAENDRPVPMLSMIRGDVLARLGRIDEAKQAMQQETTDFPANREAWIRLAALFVLEGRLDRAEATFAALIERHPSAETARLIAGAYDTLGRPTEARTWRSRATRLE